MQLRALTTVVLVLVSASASLAGPITEIVAFGDSLTDTGNVYLATGGATPLSPPYYNGRYSNGPVLVERLASRLGLPAPAPNLIGGTNYAFGGATTGIGLSPLGTLNIGSQVSTFLSGSPVLSASQIFFLYGGANDFALAGQTDPLVPVMNLIDSIITLANAGAEQFLVPNLPPLGSTPELAGTPYEAPLNALTVAFNGLLDAELDAVETSFDLTIFRLDVFGITQQAFADPAAFGFTNVQATALDTSTGLVVPNPDEYLFWDGFHPTAAAHEILGDQAFLAVTAPVPEPTSLALLGLGAVGLCGYARRRGN